MFTQIYDRSTILVDYKVNPYSYYIDQLLKKLTPLQRQYYDTIYKASNECFITAKNNQPIKSREIYHQKCESFNLFSKNQYWWVQIFCGPFITYFFHSIKNYEKSLYYTKVLIERIQQQEELGETYLLFSEAQQLHNISRIYFRSEDYEDAVEYAVKGLQVLVDKDTLFERENMVYDNVSLEELVKATEYDMILQILVETISTILKLNMDNEMQLSYIRIIVDELSVICFSTLKYADERFNKVDLFIACLFDVCNRNWEEVLVYINQIKREKIFLRLILRIGALLD